VVQVSGGAPGAHKQRRPVNQDQIQIFRGNRVDTIFRAGLLALLFFFKMLLMAFHPHPAHNAADMTGPANPIRHSFELTAERCEDLAPLVYRRLFREHPEAEKMFRSEGGDLVRGSMLAFTIDAIMDFAGDRTGHFRMISCEVQSHDAYGTPRELFGKFFGVIANTMRELLGADWSPEIEDAWRRLLAELDGVVAQPEA
jgi:hemoglobin-like flavoprotein